MSRVFQCDRCKTIFEPRVLQNGEPYIARKGNRDIDLCPKCYELLKDFLSDYDKEQTKQEADNELEAQARWICCPMCDRKKCNRNADDCDAKKWIEKKVKEGEEE